MSGIFGCWHLDGRPVDTDTFHHCLERIHPAQVRPSCVWHEGPVALGYKPNGNPGDAAPIGSGHAVCVFDGRLDNRKELIAILDRASLHPRSPDCDVVRAAYAAFGDDFVGRIKGDFACAVFDVAEKRLLVARDCLGVRPLCFTQLGDTLLFATEAKALLAWPGISAAPDDLMIADFVLQFVARESQNRTFFRDIRSLPPAHVLIATPRGTTVHRYFDFDRRRRVTYRSVEDYVEAFRALFAASVRNRLRNDRPVGVSVSGGLDSSYIFSVAARIHHERAASCPAVLGFNYSGQPGTASYEDDFVRTLERSCELSIRRVPQQAGFMEFAADEVWHSESPLVEGLACQRQAMFRHLREAGAARLLTGHWGDQVLFDADYLADLFWAGKWSVLKQHSQAWGLNGRRLARRVGRDFASRYVPARLIGAARRLRRHTDPASRASWYTERFRRLLRDRFDDDRLARNGAMGHAWAIYQQSRRVYHVQCMEWNTRVAAMHGLEIAFPYLDCDLLQFLMSIPGEVQSHGGEPRGLMRNAMRGIVPDVIVDRRTKGEFTYLANQSIECDFDNIAEILGPSSRAVHCGYVEGPALWSLLNEWRKEIQTSQNATLTNRVLELCGIELLLRQFTTPRQPVKTFEPQLSVPAC